MRLLSAIIFSCLLTTAAMPAIQASTLVDETQLEDETPPTRLQKFKRFLRKYPILSTTAGVAAVVLTVLAGQQVFGGRGAVIEEKRSKKEQKKHIKLRKDHDNSVANTIALKFANVAQTFKAVVPPDIQKVYEEVAYSLGDLHRVAGRFHPPVYLLREGHLTTLRNASKYSPQILRRTKEFLNALEQADEPWFHSYWLAYLRESRDSIYHGVAEYVGETSEDYIQKMRDQLAKIEAEK